MGRHDLYTIVPLGAADWRTLVAQSIGRGLRLPYPTHKFDSDPERRFAVVLEKDTAVRKWFKPGKRVFQIHYNGDDNYEPDFVVETETEKLLCGPSEPTRCRTRWSWQRRAPH